MCTAHCLIVLQQQKPNRSCTMNHVKEFEFFQKEKSKKLSYDFNGGNLSSEGGLLLLREFDEKLGFSQRITECIKDRRNQDYITHQMSDLVQERLYMLMQGYEDCNDATYLRRDPTFKAILNRTNSDEDLASQPTLCRLENRVTRQDIKKMIAFQIDRWLDSYKTVPNEIVLDIDSTDDPTHGAQQMTLFHGYYAQYMYHPLIFGCDGCVIFSYLRPGTNHASRKVIPLMRFLLKKIKARFPNVQLRLRADAGFSTPRLIDFLEAEKIQYAIGMITNKRLIRKNNVFIQKAQEAFDQTQEKQRLFQSFKHKVNSWPHSRTVIAKAEVMNQGTNNRFLVSNISESPDFIYDTFYTQRGQYENDIKELKAGAYADRLSCHRFIANQFRLTFSTFAYQLMFYFKQLLKNTALESASIQSIRLNLFKVAVRVRQSVRRLWFDFTSSFVHQDLFQLIHQKILAIQI